MNQFIAGTIKLPVLNTGKPHVSFSELNSWKACSWRHKLQQIDKVDIFKPSFALDFGTSTHAAHEHFIKTKVMDASIAIDSIKKLFHEHELDDEIELACDQAEKCLSEVPAFYDAKFPGWEPIDAEHLLYEKINDAAYFKGYIDAVISVPKGKKKLIYIIDLKTSHHGWLREKRQDKMTANQLVLYKHFWASKMNAEFKDVRCGFVILNRTAKAGRRCDFLNVSVGPTTDERAMDLVTTMVSAIQRRTAVKNKTACKWCDFFGTPHCDSRFKETY